MKLDRKQALIDNITEQWLDLDFRDKQDAVYESVGTATFFVLLGSSSLCAIKGNWPASFYNLTLAGGVAALLMFTD